MEGGYEMSGGVSCAVDLFFSKEDPVMGGQQRRKIGVLGLGAGQVIAVANYVDRGAPHALDVKLSFNLNYDLEFDTEGLQGFLEECFPDLLTQARGNKLLEQVAPGRRYTVRSFDMS